MRRNRLLNLYTDNKGKGSFRAQGNEIFIYDVIVSSQWEADVFGGVAPEGFIAALSAMKGDVTLRINSPGGDVFGARAMEQAIRAYSGKVTAQVDGFAASAASLLVASADKAVMAPGSMLMIHNAWTMCVGDCEDMLSMADVLEKIDSTISQTYAAKSGKDAAHYKELMAAETWFTPEEAKAEGLADEITETGKAKAAWNLGVYAKAPPVTAGEPEPEIKAADTADEIERRSRIHAVRLLAATA